MGYLIIPEGTMGAAGADNITLVDEATNILNHQVQFPITPGENGPAISVTFPGDGYISIADNNRLQVSIGIALASGGVSVVAWGYEV